MNPLALIFKEIRYHKGNAVWSLLALTTAVAIFVTLAMVQAAAEKETKRITRDLGFNLRIIPKSADMSQFYLNGFTQETMPEQLLDKMASQPGISYNHLVATLHQQVQINGVTALVTGLSKEKYPPGQKKPDMAPKVKPGSVHLGHEIARLLNSKRDQQITLGSKTFQVERVMPEAGTSDDMRIIAQLEELQAALGLQGQINEIKAIDCLCLTPDKEPLKILRAELEKILPEAKVVMLSDMAETRARQRQLMTRQIKLLTPVVLVAVAAWLISLGMINARQRLPEIGLLRALGYDSLTIASLFLGKAILIGVIGATLGYYIGSAITLSFGPEIFQLTAKGLKQDYTLLRRALTVAPLFAALCSLIPTWFALTRDPATTLRKD